MSNVSALKNGTDDCLFDIGHVDAILNGRDAAKLSGLALNTLNTYRSLKRGPTYYRVGRRVYYSRTDLTDWCNRTPSKRGRRPYAQQKGEQLAA